MVSEVVLDPLGVSRGLLEVLMVIENVLHKVLEDLFMESF